METLAWGWRLEAEDSCLLGCCAMSASKQLWMFQMYKGPFASVSMDCLTVKLEALQSFQNICNYCTVDMTCCSRRHSSSFTIIPPKKKRKRLCQLTSLMLRSLFWISWHLKLDLISCPEMSVWNYHPTLHNISLEHRPRMILWDRPWFGTVWFGTSYMNLGLSQVFKRQI
jgi:hypothetical protein